MLLWIFPVAGIAMIAVQIVHVFSMREQKKQSCGLPQQFTRFSVSEHLERIDRICCELSEDREFTPVELWWGYDGWREKPDGTFEKVRRWKPEPVQQGIYPQALQLGMQIDYSNCQCINAWHDDLLQRHLLLQTQAAQLQPNQRMIAMSTNPFLVHAPQYTSDLNWCCSDFHRPFL